MAIDAFGGCDGAEVGYADAVAMGDGGVERGCAGGGCCCGCLEGCGCGHQCRCSGWASP